jgi:non-specific serine/threonine protein kinase
VSDADEAERRGLANQDDSTRFVGSFSSELPSPTTRLIGRQREIQAIDALLRQPEVRLVTLVGPPGVGKSRLALAAAHSAAAAFEQEPRFIPLAGLGEASLLTSAIARAIGIGETREEPLVRAIETALRLRSTLLVLDGFDGIDGGAELLTELLAACPRLTVLATAGMPLHVYGERQVPVLPLELPPLTPLPALEQLVATPAVALFVERARSIRPDFALTPASAPAIAQICWRLDGLPLAIELAATRANLLTPEMLLARMEQGLSVLEAPGRDGPWHQPTLRQAIDHTCDLLSPAERALFRRLSVFQGGWTLEAAEAVCFDESPRSDVLLEQLSVLVDRSLVLVDHRGGGVRYRLLETIRELASEQLGASGEQSRVRSRHMDWCLALCEAAEPRLRGSEQALWLDRLEAELGNVRAAVEWSLSPDQDAEQGLRLVTALARLWCVRGHLAEGRRWLTRLLARADESAPARGEALTTLGLLGFMQGDRAAATAALGAVLHERHRFSPDTVARALVWMAMTLLREGDGPGAKKFTAEARALARETGTSRSLYTALIFGDIVDRATGGAGRAADVQAAIELTRSAGDLWLLGYALYGLGAGGLASGRFEQARTSILESLQTRWSLADRLGIAKCLEALSRIAAQAGAYERAARLLGAAEALREQAGGALFFRDDADRELVVKVATAALGEAGCAAARATGRGLSLAEAVRYAAGDDREAAPASPVSAAHARQALLTPREIEVAVLIARGLTSREIAAALILSERTVDAHAEHIRGKLGLRSRLQIATWVFEQGLAERPSSQGLGR